MSKTAFGAYLKHLRELRELTQADVAEHVGVSTKIIGDWERGRYEPKFAYLVKLVSFLGAEWHDLEHLISAPDKTVTDGILFAQRRMVLPPATDVTPTPSLEQEALAVVNFLLEELHLAPTKQFCYDMSLKVAGFVRGLQSARSQ